MTQIQASENNYCKCFRNSGPNVDGTSCRKATKEEMEKGCKPKGRETDCKGPMSQESACNTSGPTPIKPDPEPEPEPVPPVVNIDRFKVLFLEDLQAINPLRASKNFDSEEKRSLGYIISQALEMIIFPLAGMILFLMIMWGGYQIINGSLTGNQTKIDLGKNKITYAIYGFFLLVASWWLWRIIEIAVGMRLK